MNAETCNYPDCHCPFDKTDKCLKGLPDSVPLDILERDLYSSTTFQRRYIMTTEPRDLDGWEKNLYKMQLEWIILKPVLQLYIGKWLKRPWNTHRFVDMFVEPQRHGCEYLIGHVLAVTTLLILGLIIGLVLALVL